MAVPLPVAILGTGSTHATAGRKSVVVVGRRLLVEPVPADSLARAG